MIKRISLVALGLVAAFSSAQQPDVSIKFNGFLNGRQGVHHWSAFRGYDSFGHYSTLGLQVTTEPGLRIFVTEKLRQIRGDGDPNSLDEAYVEGEGSWRIGKQYMPFGQGLFLRESVLSVRSDGDVGFLDLPFSLCGCDGGSGHQRGVVGRLGGNIGASIALGRRFGINATDFDLIRHPEQALGSNRGFKTILGLDFTQKQKLVTYRGELVRAQDGETTADASDTMYDLSVQYDPAKGRSLILGWTHSEAEHADFLRFQPTVKVTQNVFFEPMIRSKNRRFYDLSLGVHIKF